MLPSMREKASALSAVKSLAALTSDQVDSLVELLQMFVVEPADRSEAKDLIMDASANDLLVMLNELNSKILSVPQ